MRMLSADIIVDEIARVDSDLTKSIREYERRQRGGDPIGARIYLLCAEIELDRLRILSPASF